MVKKGLALEEAPVFYPTEEEFQNALRYISAIREQAEPYGLCRIVPPPNWQPPFALPEDWRFQTKVQKVHHLQERQGGFDSHTWRMEYERFLRKTGRVLGRWPLYAGEELDLCKLYNAVKRHGYLEVVTADRKWPAIARLMRHDGAAEQSPNAGAILRQLYQKHLLAYETWERDPARHAHSGEDSSTDDEGQDMKQAPRGGKGRGPAQLGASEMEVAAAFLELGTGKVSRGGAGGTGRGLGAAVEVETRQDQQCQACEGPGHEEKMILCDRCDSGWHIHCLSPPLAAVPPGNWYCPRCVTSEDAFGFEEGTEFTLEEFQKYANRFKRKWFGPERVKGLLPEDIEAEFWRTVEQSKQPVEVLYGSDLDASIYGSGFPRLGHARGKVAAAEWEEYARSSWNLNNMPRDDASVLNRIDDQIPGVMVPWVYIGMMFSSFCWHYEDHCLYSINYCHWGEPKKWYGVPGSHAAEFEEVMQRSFPDMFAAQPDLLFQLVTMLNPAVLRKHGVPVYTTLQGPREFVITFPRSYHGGFNTGFNCAEAVNFAPADWLPWGGVGVERYRAYHRRAIISHDHLLRVVAKGLPSLPGGGDGKAAADVVAARRWVYAELQRVLASERAQREALWRDGTTASMRIPPHNKDDRIGEEEDPECLICKYYLHLSAVVCTCRPAKLACLKHARELCECQQASERSLLYRYSLADLEDLLARVAPPPASPDLERPETPPPNDLLAHAADDSPASTALRRRAIMRQTRSPGPAAEGAIVKQETCTKRVHGRSASHAALAFSWAAQAHSTLQQRPSLEQVAALLQEADEFLWGGHEVDLVREVVTRCVEVQEWAAELAAVAGSAARRVALSRLQEAARRSATAPPVAGHAHLVRALEERLRRATAMAAKMDTAMQPGAAVPLEARQAQALLREAESVPVVLPQGAALRRLLQAAHAWVDEMRRVLGRGPVSRRRAAGELPDSDYLGSLLKQGLRLGVRPPEVATVEALVGRVRQWQATARQLQAHTGPLKVLQACLREAEQLPAQVHEMDSLAARVLTAEEWQRRARKGLAPEGPPLADEAVAPADRAARLRLLRGLLAEGSRLNLEMAELPLLAAEVQQQAWLEGACRALAEPPTLQHLAHIVQEGDRLGVGGSVLARLSALSGLAADWEGQAAALLARRGSVDELAALQRVADSIPARLPSLKQVMAAQAAARAWGERAHPYLRSKQSRRHTKGAAGKAALLQVAELEALVAEGAVLAVSLKEADVLAARLAEVAAWRERAAALVAAGAGAAEAAVAVLVADGEAMGLDLRPHMDQLHARAAAIDWERRAKQDLAVRQELAVVAALLREARPLAVDGVLLGAVEAAVAAGQAWGGSVEAVLRGGVGDKTRLADLEALEAAGRSLPVLLPALYRQLEHLLAHHRQWAAAVQRAVGPARQGAVARQDLERLLAEGEASVVQSAALVELRTTVGAAAEWEGHLRRALAKKGASADVATLLDKVAASLQAGLAQVRGITAGGARLFCACQQEFEEAGNMIACDACDQWYHLRCVGLTQAAAAGMKRYTCPYCAALHSGALPLEPDALAKLRASRQPALASLLDLHHAAAALPCSLESAAVLGIVVALAQEYTAAAQAILDTARTADPAAGPLKATPLLPLLKSVAVCEVALPGVLPGVLAAMHALTWRAKAARALDGATPPAPRTLARLLKEVPPGMPDEAGSLLARVQEMEVAAAAWLEHAKQVANDGGAAPVAEVEALIAAGRALPVLLDKECQELAERCVLYCVCRKPYDEELAMIACDRCNQWFHYTCVGLAEPRTPPGKRAGGEVEVDLDFLCADCTQAVARKRAAAAEKRRLQQERKAERARREEQADAAHEQGGQEGGTHEGPGAARSPGPAAVHDGGEASEAGGALPVVPAGLKRKRSVTTRKAKVLPLVSLLEGDPGESDSERSPEGGQGGEGGEGGEDGDVAGEARRPARRTAGVNHKYANGYYVLG